MRESDIQRLVQIRATELGARLFRNETGFCECRKVSYGLCKGSPDLVGFVPVKITEDMVGQTVAVFLAPEIKARKGKLTQAQENWIEMARSFGALAGVCRSTQDLDDLLSEPFGPGK